MTRDECSVLEKAFWEMIFGSVDVLPVYGFLQTSFRKGITLNDSVIFDDEDYDADFGQNYRDNMISQFKQDLYNKRFSDQDQDKRDDGLQKRNIGVMMLLKCL